ncbi:hypothetical protein SAMN05216167_121100 [Spirosoma endophyticum]|uniref:Uncharacterized protein n=1 Tax=Spirosoma endophyticum TaxID=662367 RepID=A0A1I2EBT6_9BACT|nr:hypothetical protein SAMN05216167_121100 [Spirosoma endophyticum]
MDNLVNSLLNVVDYFQDMAHYEKQLVVWVYGVN